jgi:3-deoxy-7-phosphoheptulonate synthase
MSHLFKLASRESKHQNSEIQVGSVIFGKAKVVIIAGPCAIESRDQLFEVAKKVKLAGATMLRAGAFKPRTSPYTFAGLGIEGLKMLKEISEEIEIPTVTEVLDIHSIEECGEFSDMLQIGSRNMQNVNLLKAVGRSKKPVLLKRGMSSTITEFLLAAEYILASGNPNVVLCERGIRTFETETRNTLSLSAIPLVKELSHLPIIIDPSHATGRSSLVISMTKAGIAAGSDGIMIDVHPNPNAALCDGKQALTPAQFIELVDECRPIAKAVDRSL